MERIKELRKQKRLEEGYLKLYPDISNEKNFKEICWKASMFDCLNKGIAVYDVITGKQIDRYSTQSEVAKELKLTPLQVWSYLNKKVRSKKYLMKIEPYYTYEDWYKDESNN